MIVFTEEVSSDLGKPRYLCSTPLIPEVEGYGDNEEEALTDFCLKMDVLWPARGGKAVTH